MAVSRNNKDDAFHRTKIRDRIKVQDGEKNDIKCKINYKRKRKKKEERMNKE